MTIEKYAYHVLKNSFVGDSIYPLNILKEIHPEIYKFEAKKYMGREELTKNQNPILDCLWNDVVQFSCLDPKITLNEACKYDPMLKGKVVRIFALDLENINEQNACLFYPSVISGYCHDREQYTRFQYENYMELSELPIAQINKWKSNVIDKKPIFLWSATPHLLYKGTLELRSGIVREYTIGAGIDN